MQREKQGDLYKTGLICSLIGRYMFARSSVVVRYITPNNDRRNTLYILNKIAGNLYY